MADDPQSLEAALRPLMTSLAHLAARASADLGIELDLDDPRVARWMLLVSLEALFTPSARRPLEETLALAADLPAPDMPAVRRRNRKRRNEQRLVTWDDLVSSAAAET
jgi:hypothetical protein